MLLYRIAKIMEDHSKANQGGPDPFADLAELTQGEVTTESVSVAALGEDCSDWGREATY